VGKIIVQPKGIINGYCLSDRALLQLQIQLSAKTLKLNITILTILGA